ncbi:MAG TPA: VIT and VWA domain-containing protein [Kofleriaceae bacterium]|nr:VIT and VWA domain-containing protein [Kofleriaceae bacterium]
MAQPQQLATDRVEALMLATDGRPMPIHEERLDIMIDGEYATTTMHQTYLNKSGARIEGTYQLRPGTGSHVDGFAYWNGEQKIVGEVFEKQTAHRVYDSVVARKRDPGLLEENGEGQFSFKVFPIEANENKRVEVRWTKWLERHAQVVHYHAPITSRDAEVVAEIHGPVKNVRSSTHKLRFEKLANGVRVRADGAAAPGELVLDWDIDEPAWTPDAFVQAGQGPDEGWFALALAAPRLPEATVTAKDMTIVIDHSGSMTTDDKMEHAKRAAIDMVDMLGPKDHINVISFSDEVDPLFKSPQPMTRDNREQALAFIERLHPTGGTDIALALKTAVADQTPGSENPQVVVFLTDGQSDAAQADAVKTGNVRLFTLGLGSDVNKPLLSRLAAQRRGRFVFIENASAIEPEVRRLATNIAKPLLVDVVVTVDGANATRMYPRTLPDLFAEDELRVSGRLRGTGTVKFKITGKLSGKPVEFTRTVEVGKATSRPWTAPLWAQSRIDHLLEEIALDGSKTEFQNEVLELALAYNFVTPYTAFLAVPESELGQMHDTVAQARQEKARIMKNNPDVASAGAPHVRMMASQDKPDDADDDRDARMDHKKRVAKVDDDAGDAESPNAGPPVERMFAPDSKESAVQSAPVTTTGSASHAHGCAGCAMTGGNGASSALLILGTLLMLRRRRR